MRRDRSGIIVLRGGTYCRKKTLRACKSQKYVVKHAFEGFFRFLPYSSVFFTKYALQKVCFYTYIAQTSAELWTILYLNSNDFWPLYPLFVVSLRSLLAGMLCQTLLARAKPLRRKGGNGAEDTLTQDEGKHYAIREKTHRGTPMQRYKLAMSN